MGPELLGAAFRICVLEDDQGCRGCVYVCVCLCVCMWVCVCYRGVCVCVFIQSLNRVRLSETPCAVACQPPLSMGFFRQEYCSGLLFPPGDLADPGMEP